MRRFAEARRVPAVLCLTLLALAPASRAADGARPAVALPEAAFGEEMQGVIWLDLGAVSAEALTAARHALVDAIAPQPAKDANAAAADAKPDDSRERMDQELKAGAGEFLKFRDAAVNAGAQELVLGVRAPEAKAAGGKDSAVVFVRMREGADPQKLFQAMRMFDAVRKEAGAVAGKAADADDRKFDPNQYDAKRWSGQWFNVTGPKLAAPTTKPPGGGAAAAAAGANTDAANNANDPRSITQSFADALAHEQGAPLRVALRMNDAIRRQIQTVLQGPNALMLRGLAEPLLSMRTASAGLTLGDRPTLHFGLHFANADQAAQFKGTLDRTVTMMSAFASMAALGNKNQDGQNQTQIKPELIQAAVAPLMMRQEGADLSTSIDTTFVAKLRELGVGAKATGGQVAPPRTGAENQPAAKG